MLTSEGYDRLHHLTNKSNIAQGKLLEAVMSLPDEEIERLVKEAKAKKQAAKEEERKMRQNSCSVRRKNSNEREGSTL